MLINRGKNLTAAATPLTSIDLFKEAITEIYTGKTIDFDEHRDYVFGDDPRDIDWKATARTGSPLIKKFLPQEQYLMTLLADTGVGMTGSAPSGELKQDLAMETLCVAGLIAMAFQFQFSYCQADSISEFRIGQGRSDTHLERILELLYRTRIARENVNDPVHLLRFGMQNNQRRSVFFLATEEPKITPELLDAIRLVQSRHYIIWAIIEDMELLSLERSLPNGFDVLTGKHVLREGIDSPKLYQLYNESERKRRAEVEDFFTKANVRMIRIGSSQEIVPKLQELTWSFV